MPQYDKKFIDMNHLHPTHYETLGVAPDAPLEVIRAAHQALLQKYHLQGTPAQLHAINIAYETLSSPTLRAQYDLSLRTNTDKTTYTRPAPTQKSATPYIAGALVALCACIVGILIIKRPAPAPMVSEKPIVTTTTDYYPTAPADDTIDKETTENTPIIAVDIGKAKTDYEKAIKTINTVWESLPSAMRDDLRNEQKTINAKREFECAQKAQSQNAEPADYARYICETLQLYARAEKLAKMDKTPYLDRIDDTADPTDTTDTSGDAAYDEYLTAVAHINEVWGELPDSLRDEIRGEQQADIARRERECSAQARQQTSNPQSQKAIRYECESEQIYERAEYLQNLDTSDHFNY